MPISECGESSVAASVASVATNLFLSSRHSAAAVRMPTVPESSNATHNKAVLSTLARNHENMLKRSAEEWSRQQARDAALEKAKAAAAASAAMPPPPPQLASKRRCVERNFEQEAHELDAMFDKVEAEFKKAAADKDACVEQIKEFVIPATDNDDDAERVIAFAKNMAHFIHDFVTGKDVDQQPFIGLDFLGMIKGRMSCGCPIQSDGTTVEHMVPNCKIWVDELCDLETRPLVNYLLYAVKRALNIGQDRRSAWIPAHLRPFMAAQDDALESKCVSLAASIAKIVIIAMRTHHHLVKCGACMFVPCMLLVSQASVESEWQRYASKIVGYFLPASVQERFPTLKDELVAIARDTEQEVRTHSFWCENDRGNQSRGVLNKQVRVLEFLASGVVTAGEGKKMRVVQTCAFDSHVCPIVASKEGGMNCDPWKIGLASVRRNTGTFFHTAVPGPMSPMAHNNLCAIMACGGTGVNTAALEFLRALLNKDATSFDIGDVLCTARGVRYMSSATRRVDLLRRIAAALRPVAADTKYEDWPVTTCLLGPMAMEPVQMLHVIVRAFDGIIKNVPASLAGMHTEHSVGHSAPIRTTAHLNRGLSGPAPSTVKALGDAANAIVTVSAIVCFAIHTLRHHVGATPRVGHAAQAPPSPSPLVPEYVMPPLSFGNDDDDDIGLPVDERPPQNDDGDDDMMTLAQRPVNMEGAASVCGSVAGTTITGLADAWKHASQHR